MASTYLSRTTGVPTSAKKFTMSGWFKLSYAGTNTMQFLQTYHDVSNREHLYFDQNKLKMYGVDGGSAAFNLVTNRLFRDTNSWYHIVVACDTTQGTAANRIKIYVNGVQETSFSTETYPAQDFTFRLNTNSQSLVMGRYMGSNNYYYDGIISHFNFIDGTQYAASDFGETDSTTGEWKIKTSPSVTYGNNGFFILKDGNSVTDQSPNTNNFTVSAGTLTKTEDNPSNVFATWNLNWYPGNNMFGINGNTKLSEPSNVWQTSVSTLANKTGKYYMEYKCEGNYAIIGCLDINNSKNGINDKNFGSSTDITSYGYGYYNSDGKIYNAGSNSSFGNTFGNNDIMGVALDCDNKKIYFSKNGVWENSGVPTSGSTGTGAVSLATGDDRCYVMACSVANNNIGSNFGNGYFGTSAVSSAGTNASGNGIFEYDVPTGYTALSTKGLNL